MSLEKSISQSIGKAPKQLAKLLYRVAKKVPCKNVAARPPDSPMWLTSSR